MNLKNIIILAVIALVLSSCNQDKVFDDEQYKNTFAFISENEENVYNWFFDYRNQESIGYISLSMGGSNAIKDDVKIKIVEDKSFIDAYNRTNFDMNVDKYINPLPKSKYDIESLECTISAGSTKATVPFKIRPAGLSPDSSYFISVRVDSYNRYEVNPEKSYLLYRIRTKNYWAMAGGSTSYMLRGYHKTQGAGSETMVPGMKVMHPISKDEVRIVAGTEVYASNREVLNKSAIVVKVLDDNRVEIKPYKSITVTQIDGDAKFPNIFKIEDDGFKTYKTFLLYYSYVIDGTTYEMKEELRLQFNPDIPEVI